MSTWFYVASAHFESATKLVGTFVDIVSKNGCIMLDVGPKVMARCRSKASTSCSLWDSGSK
jgi:alpha-L-fucosidase